MGSEGRLRCGVLILLPPTTESQACPLVSRHPSRCVGLRSLCCGHLHAGGRPAEGAAFPPSQCLFQSLSSPGSCLLRWRAGQDPPEAPRPPPALETAPYVTLFCGQEGLRCCRGDRSQAGLRDYEGGGGWTEDGLGHPQSVSHTHARTLSHGYEHTHRAGRHHSRGMRREGTYWGVLSHTPPDPRPPGFLGLRPALGPLPHSLAVLSAPVPTPTTKTSSICPFPAPPSIPQV